MSASACLLALFLAPSQGNVWVVAPQPGPGVDFTNVQSAVDQAAEGDTLFLRIGIHESFTINAKSLTVLGDPFALLGEGTGDVLVRNLGTSQRVVLRNLAAASEFLFLNNLGPVWIESCHAEAFSATTNGALTFVDCKGPCNAEGTRAAYFRCEMKGSPGGSPGLRVSGASTVLVEGCTLEGGIGEAGEFVDTFTCTDGEQGGPGLALLSTLSKATVIDSALVGGPGGAPGTGCFCSCSQGPAGAPWTSVGAPPAFASGTSKPLDLHAPVPWPGTFRAAVEGTPGELAFLLHGKPYSPLFTSPIEGLLAGAPPLLTVTAPFGVIALGVVPPSGVLAFEAPVSAPPAGTAAGTLHLQLLTFAAGVFELGEGSTAPLIDLGSIDCNGNGLHDSLDLLSGASCDLDGDGVLDECQVPFAVPGELTKVPDEWLESPNTVNLAASGDTLLVGLPDVVVPGLSQGVALVYDVAADATMTMEAVLQPADAVFVSKFGTSVKLDGDVALVASIHQHGSTSSGAFVFRRSAGGVWNQEAELVAGIPASAGNLGMSVALSGSLAAVGAPGDGLDIGAVVLFRGDAPGVWVEEAVLTPSDALAGGEFGSSMDMDGNLLAISGAHSVYVFRRTAPGVWVEEAKLDVAGIFAVSAQNDWIALEGDVLAVGRQAASPSGAVSIYRRGGGVWSFESELIDSGQTTSVDGLGAYIDLKNGVLIASADSKEYPLNNTGAVLAWRDSGAGVWTYLGTLGPIPTMAAEGGEHFGTGVAIDGRLFVRSLGPGGGSGSGHYLCSFAPIPSCP